MRLLYLEMRMISVVKKKKIKKNRIEMYIGGVMRKMKIDGGQTMRIKFDNEKR